jgi:hypothetical protein
VRDYHFNLEIVAKESNLRARFNDSFGCPKFPLCAPDKYFPAGHPCEIYWRRRLLRATHLKLIREARLCKKKTVGRKEQSAPQLLMAP